MRQPTDHERPIVAIVEDVWGPAFDELANDLDLRRAPDAWQDERALAKVLAGARGVVVRNQTRVGRALLEGNPSLAIIARAGVGLDNIDLAAADELGVVVSAALGANARSVAELTIGLALSLARDIPVHDRQLRAGSWERREGRELAGQSWGAVGLGATGRATLALAQALGLTTVGYDPLLAKDTPIEHLDLRTPQLDDLLALCDVVSLHLPSTPETRGLVDASFFASMRTNAFLISVGRGDVIVEDALLDALDQGVIAGAALDVRATEPPLLGPLERHDRVVLTPHIAGLTGAAQDRITDMLASDLTAVLSGSCAAHAVGKVSAPRRRSP